METIHNLYASARQISLMSLPCNLNDCHYNELDLEFVACIGKFRGDFLAVLCSWSTSYYDQLSRVLKRAVAG